MVLRALSGGLAPTQFPTVALEHGCPALRTCWRHDELPDVLSNGYRGQEPSAEGCLQQLVCGLGHGTDYP